MLKDIFNSPHTDQFSELRSEAKQALKALDDAMKTQDATEIANAKSSAKKARQKLFAAMFDDAVDELRPHIIRLSALYRLSKHDCIIRQPWHFGAMQECLKRLNLTEAITRQESLTIKTEELGQ